MGYLDSDGYLYVLGREKSLLISSNGEKYSPEGIEEALISGSPFVDQVMLYNEQDPYTVALIVPNREAVREVLAEKGLSCLAEEGQAGGPGALPGRDRVVPGRGREGRTVRLQLAPGRVRHPGRRLHGREPDAQQHLKMVRRRITEFYRDRLDYLYTPEGKDPYNRRNWAIIARMDPTA